MNVCHLLDKILRALPFFKKDFKEKKKTFVSEISHNEKSNVSNLISQKEA